VAVVFPRTPRPAARRLLDAAVLLWAVGWIVVGILVAREVRALGELSETVVVAGEALGDAGTALASLEGVPFVGEDIREVGERTERAAESAGVSGRSSRESIDSLSLLLGIAIALGPSFPLVALYLPMRLAWSRDLRSLRRALTAFPGEPGLEEYLARRAALALPYDRLHLTTAAPWGALAAADRRRLSDAELERVGIRRSNGH
jgi:hypothetical protein